MATLIHADFRLCPTKPCLSSDSMRARRRCAENIRWRVGTSQLDGKLPVRVHAYVPLATWPKLAALVATEGRGGGHLTWGGVKAFMDGSLGSRTALLHSPYEDDNTTSGLRVEELQDVLRHVRDADAAGLQARNRS
jgi:predicted amidohydrolase YtcJ